MLARIDTKSVCASRSLQSSLSEGICRQQIGLTAGESGGLGVPLVLEPSLPQVDILVSLSRTVTLVQTGSRIAPEFSQASPTEPVGIAHLSCLIYQGCWKSDPIAARICQEQASFPQGRSEKGVWDSILRCIGTLKVVFDPHLVLQVDDWSCVQTLESTRFGAEILCFRQDCGRCQFSRCQ